MRSTRRSAFTTRTRSITALAAAGATVLAMLGLVVSAPGAAAADASPSMIDVYCLGGTSDVMVPGDTTTTTVTGAVGDTFIVYDSGTCDTLGISLTPNSAVYSADNYTLVDPPASPSSATITITGPGTIALSAGTGALTINVVVPITASPDIATIYPTASFDANGGTCIGTMQVTKTPGSSGEAAAPTCTRADYALVGWANSASATSPQWGAGAAIPIGAESFTEYAVWQPIGFEVRYDANLGLDQYCGVNGVNQSTPAGRVSPAVVVPATFTLASAPPCTPPAGLRLLGWSLTPGGPSIGAPGAAPTASLGAAPQSVTLYAVWQVLSPPTKPKFTVHEMRWDNASNKWVVRLEWTPSVSTGTPLVGYGLTLADYSNGATTPDALMTLAADQTSYTYEPRGDGQLLATIVGFNEAGTSAADGTNISMRVPLPQSVTKIRTWGSYDSFRVIWTPTSDPVKSLTNYTLVSQVDRSDGVGPQRTIAVLSPSTTMANVTADAAGARPGDLVRFGAVPSRKGATATLVWGPWRQVTDLVPPARGLSGKYMPSTKTIHVSWIGPAQSQRGAKNVIGYQVQYHDAYGTEWIDLDNVVEGSDGISAADFDASKLRVGLATVRIRAIGWPGRLHSNWSEVYVPVG